MLTIPAVSVSNRVGLADVADRQRDPEGDPERRHHPDHHDQQPVHRFLQRRARMAEGARGRGHLGGVALAADRGRLEVALALDREGAGEDRVADPPHHRFGLAGQLGTRRAPARRRGRGSPSAAIWSPLPIRTRSPTTTLLDRHLARLTVAHHRRFRHHQRSELVEGALGAHLLEGPDRDVGDEDAEEERVLGVAEDDRRRAEPGEDQVEDRERVGDRDRRVGAAGRGLVRGARPRAGGALPRPRSVRS